MGGHHGHAGDWAERPGISHAHFASGERAPLPSRRVGCEQAEWDTRTERRTRRSAGLMRPEGIQVTKRPRDPNQLAKAIIGIATGEVEEAAPPEKNQAAAELGRKGGQARAKAMTSEQRAEIAKRAAQKRWDRD
jgi:hypothetical protein